MKHKILLLLLMSTLTFNASAESTLKDTVEWIIESSSHLCEVDYAYGTGNPGRHFTNVKNSDYRSMEYVFVHPESGLKSNGEIWLPKYDFTSLQVNTVKYQGSQYLEVSVKESVGVNRLDICTTMHNKNAQRFMKAFMHAIKLAKKQDIF